MKQFKGYADGEMTRTAYDRVNTYKATFKSTKKQQLNTGTDTKTKAVRNALSGSRAQKRRFQGKLPDSLSLKKYLKQTDEMDDDDVVAVGEKTRKARSAIIEALFEKKTGPKGGPIIVQSSDMVLTRPVLKYLKEEEKPMFGDVRTFMANTSKPEMIEFEEGHIEKKLPAICELPQTGAKVVVKDTKGNKIKVEKVADQESGDIKVEETAKMKVKMFPPDGDVNDDSAAEFIEDKSMNDDIEYGDLKCSIYGVLTCEDALASFPGKYHEHKMKSNAEEKFDQDRIDAVGEAMKKEEVVRAISVDSIQAPDEMMEEYDDNVPDVVKERGYAEYDEYIAERVLAKKRKIAARAIQKYAKTEDACDAGKKKTFLVDAKDFKFKDAAGKSMTKEVRIPKACGAAGGSDAGEGDEEVIKFSKEKDEEMKPVYVPGEKGKEVKIQGSDGSVLTHKLLKDDAEDANAPAEVTCQAPSGAVLSKSTKSYGEDLKCGSLRGKLGSLMVEDEGVGDGYSGGGASAIVEVQQGGKISIQTGATLNIGTGAMSTASAPPSPP